LNICVAGGASRTGTSGGWAGSDYSGAASTTNGVAATSDTFQITGVIAVPGIELPAALIMRPADQELRLCQRYYERFGAGCLVVATSTTNLQGIFSFHVQKRNVGRTVSLISGSANQIDNPGVGDFTVTAIGGEFTGSVDSTFSQQHHIVRPDQRHAILNAPHQLARCVRASVATSDSPPNRGSAMRVVLAALTLALVPPAAPVGPPRASDQVAQMARDVTDAVRKQRAERRDRAPQDRRSSKRIKR
jgi:hypothetical protein